MQKVCKKHIGRNLLLCGIAFILLLSVVRIISLNQEYPSGKILYGDSKTPVHCMGLTFQLLNGELLNSTDFFSQYSINTKSLFSDTAAEKYALFEVEIIKGAESKEQNYFFPDYSGAEKGAWKNLISPEIFLNLNPDYKPVAQMKVNETQTLLFAIGLHESTFQKETWESLDISQLDLVLSVYPFKISLQFK